MENFFLDNPDILFQLEHLDLGRVIELKEDGFKDRDAYPYAPRDAADAKDCYRRVLELIGEISAVTMAPMAAEVDEEGVKLEKGDVVYAKGTLKAMDIFKKADLMGFCLPRRYGGLNMPVSILSMAEEVVARADASFLSFGLHQDIGETINKFASAEIKERYLPRFASGEVGSSMILTEPEAGSDLQAVSTRARLGEDGRWYLTGVKRFISNGCAQIALVLARSEDGSKGGRGLSFFLYERDSTMTVRRLEHKLGIHGSPTCELQFTDAPAMLIGERRKGLVTCTAWLMNSARLGIAGQALGIAEAAYREADKYSRERFQFGKPIREITQVAEMLADMRLSIEAGRALFYETARIVDIKEGLEHAATAHPEREKELSEEIRRYTKYAGLYTPLVKAFNTEMCNRVAYDGIQVHGGPGYMRDFNAERHYRDARITSIYEGTTQLQVVAAIGGIMSGIAMERLNDYEADGNGHRPELASRISRAKNQFEKTVAFVKERGDSRLTEYHARRLSEMTTDLIQAFLLLRQARHGERKTKVAEAFCEKALPRVEMNMNLITQGGASAALLFQDII